MDGGLAVSRPTVAYTCAALHAREREIRQMSDMAAVMPHTKLQEPESVGNLARLKIGLSKGEGHVY